MGEDVQTGPSIKGVFGLGREEEDIKQERQEK